VRILRSMAGISFGQYDEAYRSTRGRRAGVVPAAELRTGEGRKKRAAQPPEVQKERARGVNDLFWVLNSYLLLACGCGTVLKIPPNFAGGQVPCPHCGTIHSRREFTDRPPKRTPSGDREDVAGGTRKGAR